MRGRCVQGPTAEAQVRLGCLWGVRGRAQCGGCGLCPPAGPPVGPQRAGSWATPGVGLGFGRWAPGTVWGSPSGGRRALCVPGRVRLLGGGPAVPTLPGGWSGAGPPSRGPAWVPRGPVWAPGGSDELRGASRQLWCFRGEVGWARFLLSPGTVTGTCHNQSPHPPRSAHPGVWAGVSETKAPLLLPGGAQPGDWRQGALGR